MRLIDVDALSSELYDIYNANLGSADSPTTAIFLDGFTRAVRVVNSSPTVMQWVSMDDRMPDDSLAKLVYTKRGVRFGTYNSDIDHWHIFDSLPGISNHPLDATPAAAR